MTRSSIGMMTGESATMRSSPPISSARLANTRVLSRVLAFVTICSVARPSGLLTRTPTSLSALRKRCALPSKFSSIAARVAVSRASGYTRNVAQARSNMAAYLVALRRYDEARTAAREALSAAHDLRWSVGLVWALQHLAAIAALRPGADAPVIEDRSRAARILGYADARLAALEDAREYTEQQEYDAMLPVLRDALGADQLAQLMAEGITWNEDQAFAEAMLI